ncbi:hypothetical protein C6P45_003902 [Maudiozyma exigua]|uniref:RRM domain-containing protein n=1 Tax=Maudiozyma exigua TaxID=34358 RepID=A0A9P6WB67_MAUEX|nr:hypothetical protein C6P45_003902 [Kazachstania exigua]
MGSIKLTRSISFDSNSHLKLSEEELSMKQRVIETSYSDVSSYESNEDDDSSEEIEESVEEMSEDDTNNKVEEYPGTNEVDSTKHTVTDDNRGLPSSCIFVASLTASLSDDKLCFSVKNRFKEFGELNGVKVLRDQENRPYAFVQYTNDQDATNALEKAHGTILDGRVIRCEPARVNRTLFITNLTPVSHVDIKQLCGTFGKLEQLVPNKDKNQLSQRFAHPVTVSNSWFIRFVYRDDAIRAFANLKMDPRWTVQWAQNVNVPKRFNMLYRSDDNIEQESNYDSINYLKKTNESMETFSKITLDNQNTTNVTIDKKSIFVGQLPKETTTENIQTHFSRYGTIADINLIHKPTNVFTFIQFETEKAAAAALEKENHSTFLEKTIHVQYKELGGYHGKRVFRRNSTYLSNSHRSNQFAGPQLNLAPPPISMYRRHSNEINSTNNYVNPNMVASNTSPNGSLPYIHCLPPNLPPNAIPNFDGNIYPYMNGSLPHGYRRGSIPESWITKRRESFNPDAQNHTNKNRKTDGQKQDTENTLRTATDTVTEIASDVSDSLDRDDAAVGGVNSTTTYNNSSAGSMVIDYKNRIERMGLTKSRNDSNDSIEYPDPVNPYLFQNYYYTPLPYHMHGMPMPDGPMIPMNFPMNMKNSGSGTSSPHRFNSFVPPQAPREKEFLDY